MQDGTNATDFGFPGSERLKRRSDIAQVFAKGKRWRTNLLAIQYLLSKNPDSKHALNTGFSVSKKAFKRAVDRNRIKRLMREAYRLQAQELRAKLAAKSMHLNLFFIYTGKGMPDFKEIYEHVTQSIQFVLTKIKA